MSEYIEFDVNSSKRFERLKTVFLELKKDKDADAFRPDEEWPNFLWMMYRSGWGTKEGQEITSAVRIVRSSFDEILSQAVHSTCVPDVYTDHASWKRAVAGSAVRLQWDPDHHPAGNPLPRRAIQLGLRGDALAKYAREWIIEIEDISKFVAEQHQHVLSKKYDLLRTPFERPYPVEAGPVRLRLQLA